MSLVTAKHGLGAGQLGLFGDGFCSVIIHSQQRGDDKLNSMRSLLPYFCYLERMPPSGGTLPEDFCQTDNSVWLLFRLFLVISGSKENQHKVFFYLTGLYLFLLQGSVIG